MEINSITNVRQIEKALYSKMISKYAQLCKLYQDLAIHLKENRQSVSPVDIVDRYSEVLSAVSYNDVENIDDLHEKGFFDQHEVNIFKSYSNVSRNLFNYREAYRILDSSISNDPSNKSINKNRIQQFHDFLQSSGKAEAQFDDYISVHSPQIIGTNYYNMAIRSLNTINEIDEDHLDIPVSDIKQKLTRSSFGGNNIKNSVNSKIDILGLTHDSLIYDDESPDQFPDFHSYDSLQYSTLKRYSKSEEKRFSRKITNVDKLKESAYVVRFCS